MFLRLLPRLTGERALPRDVLLSVDPADARGYRIEAALNSLVAERGGVVRAFVLDGMFHRPKEEKERSVLMGFAHKVGMLTVAVWEYLAYRLRRLRRRWSRRTWPLSTRPARDLERSVGARSRACSR